MQSPVIALTLWVDSEGKRIRLYDSLYMLMHESIAWHIKLLIHRAKMMLNKMPHFTPLEAEYEIIADGNSEASRSLPENRVPLALFCDAA